jgi:hypothetical protein
MERSFARASRFGFDQARWRGLWRVCIQEYLTATIQNIEVLMRYGRNPRKRPAMLVKRTNQRPPYTIVVTRQVDSGGIPLGLLVW